MDIPFTLDLRDESDMPLHRQVYEQIRTAVLTGRVRSHQKLPASRQLAQSLGISRTTVVQSYDQLISEGYLETKRGAGTFVCAQVPDALLTPATVPVRPAAINRADTGSLSAYGQRLSTTVTLPTRPPNALSFRYWRPDLSLFPIKQWQRLVNRHSVADTAWMTYSDEPMGHRPLREAIATYISQARAVNCNPEQILVTQGTQQAIALIAQVLLNDGDAIALENPGYPSARKVFCSHGAMPIPIPVDEAGLNVSALEQLSANRSAPKLVYVTPSHQFPTGVLMSLSRRLALLEWANRTGGLIVEDDYDSEYRYGGRPIPALQGLDTDGRVLYVGTFSKVMFPALRLGYVVLPPALVPVFRRAKWVCDRQCSLLHEQALATFISEGHLAKHIRRMRTVYAARRTYLVEALQTLGDIEVLGDPAGLHAMVRLSLARANLSAQGLVAKAAKVGVSLFDVAPYYADAVPGMANETDAERWNRERAFIFGFGGLTEVAIEAAIARIKPFF